MISNSQPLSSKIKKELIKFSDPDKKEIYLRFFKTGKGDYGEGDQFIGVTTPKMRAVAKKYFREISLPEISKLLSSPIHEHRSVALVMLVYQYQKLAKTNSEKKLIFDFYLKNTARINNWDLVDISCYHIVGDYLINNSEKESILLSLANSNSLWEQRISIVSTLSFIKNRELRTTLLISKVLLSHRHDLIHKAVGWMLRELGKKDQRLLEEFLKENYKNIHRTTLRYAIEKFDEPKRKMYLDGF